MHVKTMVGGALIAAAMTVSAAFGAGALAADPVTQPVVPQVLTLENALIIALGNQPSLRVAAGNQAINEARVGQARSGYFPQISGRVAYQRATANVATSFGGGPVSRNVRGDTFGTYLNNVNLNQTIFD